MKHLFSALSFAGLLVLAASIGWWAAHRGEVIDRVELHTVGYAEVGGVDARTVEADRVGEPLGPYELGPQDSPLLVSVTVDTTLADRYDFPAVAHLSASLRGEEGGEVWSGRIRVRRTVSGADLERKARRPEGGGAIIEVKGNAFRAVRLPKPDTYTLTVDLETTPAGWAEQREHYYEAFLTVRKNAADFPLVGMLAGFGLVALGAVGYSVITGEGRGKTDACHC